MHDTAFAIGKKFFDVYGTSTQGCVVEIGSRDVNGTLKTCVPSRFTYVGIDIEPGPNVDIVIAPGARLPLCDESADIVLASSVLEHDPMFWDSFVEFCRITKPDGLVYINAPSNGEVHRYPNDCWRFYPDASLALARLACTRGLDVSVIESFTADRERDMFNDFVSVFVRGKLKERADADFLHTHFSGRNVYRFDREGFSHPSGPTEDMQLLAEATRALIRLADAAQRSPEAAQTAPTPVNADFLRAPDVQRIARMLGGELARDLQSLGSSQEANLNLGPFEALFQIVCRALDQRTRPPVATLPVHGSGES